MELKIGEIYKLKIIDITHKGQGVGKIEGLTIFVDGAMSGDVVEIEIQTLKSNYAIGKLQSIIEPSPDKVSPPCPEFEKCGGCVFQNISKTAQAKIKKKFVVDSLERIGGFDGMESFVKDTQVMDEPMRYRNKAQYKISKDAVGFYAINTHHVIDIKDCLNQPQSCVQVIECIRKIKNEKMLSIYDEKKHRGQLRGVVQRTTQQGDEMIVLVVTEINKKQEAKLIQLFSKILPSLKSLNININTKKGNQVMGNHTYCIYGEPTIQEKLMELKFIISPRSFFQVNTRQTEVLYTLAGDMAGLDGTQVLWDLYCGIGTIGLSLAHKAKSVIGIEIVPEAIEDAKINAQANDITNASFLCGKAEVLIDNLVKNQENPDVVIVDPPRKGLEQNVIDKLVEVQVPKVVYVSCNPASMARDMKLFVAGGYQMEEVVPVDMFPETGHVECAVLMSRV